VPQTWIDAGPSRIADAPQHAPTAEAVDDAPGGAHGARWRLRSTHWMLGGTVRMTKRSTRDISGRKGGR